MDPKVYNTLREKGKTEKQNKCFKSIWKNSIHSEQQNTRGYYLYEKLRKKLDQNVIYFR